EPLLERVANKRVLGLQVKDVVFVDARRHHEQRRLVNLGDHWRVLDQLKKRVLENDFAVGNGQVIANLKTTFVGLRQIPFLQIAIKILNTLEQRHAVGLQQRVLRVGIGRHEVGGSHGVEPLHGRETQLFTG